MRGEAKMSLRDYNRGGRPSGSRNRLSKQFIDDLLAEWQEHGRKAIKLMRMERPGDFVRVVAGTLPKEFIVENVLTEIDDDELDRMIVRLRTEVLEEHRQAPMIELKPESTDVERATVSDAGGRTPAAKDRE
jgi:hypothetical protein